MNIHQEFWIFFNKNDHKLLALWAAECAERVMPFFEEKYPEDHHPGKAIETLREWIKTGEFKMSVIRGASLASHAAAREVNKEEKAACFAARAAGQAVATAHVPTHALGSALYPLKAIAYLNPEDAKAAVTKERSWQLRKVPKNLRQWVESGLIQKQSILPKNLRA